MSSLSPLPIGEHTIEVNDNLTRLIGDHMVLNAAMIYDRATQLPKTVPHTILPTVLYEPIANRMVESQIVMQKLYAKIAMDHNFLLEHLKPMAQHDEYLEMLIRTLEFNMNRGDSPICLVARSDFMIHERNMIHEKNVVVDPSHESQSNAFGPIVVKNTQYIPQQVEFNTMSSGLIGISQRVQRLHEYLLRSTELGLEPIMRSAELAKVGKFVPNLGQNGTAATLASGVEWFQRLLSAQSRTKSSSSPSTTPPSSPTPYPAPIVLMVTQENEFNVPDQRMIEYALREGHGFGLIRASLSQVEQNVTFMSLAKLVGCGDDQRMVPMWMDKVPIAVVYYRSCYTPTDFFMLDGEEEEKNEEQHCKNAQTTSSSSSSPLSSSSSPIPLTAKQRRVQLYRNLEASVAVKCPNIGLFLSGMKKIQQLLTQRDILSRYLGSDDEIEMLHGLFAEIYSLQDLDATTTPTSSLSAPPSSSSSSCQEQRNRAIQSALANPDLWVLKPMREGGGNNLYGEDLRKALLKEDGASDCVLMKKIITSQNDYNVVLPPSSLWSSSSPASTLNKSQAICLPLIPEYGVTGGLFAEVMQSQQLEQHQPQYHCENTGRNDASHINHIDSSCQNGQCILTDLRCDLLNVIGDQDTTNIPHLFHHNPTPSTPNNPKSDHNSSIPKNNNNHNNQLCIRYNETFGVLVRSKRLESNEGGLAIGKAFVSSLIMVPVPEEDS